jgi:O-Glycosyl hydrolase
MFERAKDVLDDPQAAQYVWGVGFHWYCGDHFDNVQLTHDA